MKDNKVWDKREKVVCGPGSNRIRAKARRSAKLIGNRIKRRQSKNDLGRAPELESWGGL